MKEEYNEFVKYNNDKLIGFYVENGLEFDENKGYFGNNINSLAIVVNGEIVGAVSFSIYKNNSFIEALAVDRKYRKKGYGKILLKKAIEQLNGDIYTISKADKFYLENGFNYSNEDLIGNECKICEEYNVTCFPKVMVYKK